MQDRPARPGAIFLDCYDSRGRIPEELTQPPFLSACLQVSSAWPTGNLRVRTFQIWPVKSELAEP